jgi:hypothetical protein
MDLKDSSYTMDLGGQLDGPLPYLQTSKNCIAITIETDLDMIDIEENSQIKQMGSLWAVPHKPADVVA